VRTEVARCCGDRENARAQKRIATHRGLVDSVDAWGIAPGGHVRRRDADTGRSRSGGRRGRDSAAEQVLAASPDLVMQMEDGTTVTAREALDAARAQVEQAKNDSQAFDAAVSCFLARG